jgi:hypothetical protein
MIVVKVVVPAVIMVADNSDSGGSGSSSINSNDDAVSINFCSNSNTDGRPCHGSGG